MSNFRGILFVALACAAMSFAQTGPIVGKAIDARTSEPLVGVNVVVTDLENVGAATDVNGAFEIPSVPAGGYSIMASLIGYQTVVKTGVVVRSGRATQISFEMKEAAVEMGEVTVVADYFDQSKIENEVSALSLDAEEVRRSPGSSLDYQRILQAMPGVSFSSDQTNELLVRGGAPDENLTVLDHIEIHSTNHYPNEYNSGGPINMINVDMIDDIEFSTGGFIAKYGDKLSSVTRIETRDGTRERSFAGNANLSMAGYGAVLEGKLGERGSWIVSARKSYINLIAGSFGLTAIPYYWDAQWKASYNLTRDHKLQISGVYGNDRIDFEGDADHNDPVMANQTDSVGLENVNVEQWQYAAGITLKSVWSESFYSALTIFGTNYHNGTKVNQEYVERRYDGAGDVTDTEVIGKRRVFEQDDDNGVNAFKSEFVWNVSRSHQLEFGGAIKFVRFDADQFASDAKDRYDFDDDGVFDTVVTTGDAYVDYDFKFPEEYKAYGYLNERAKLFDDRLVLNLGGRVDYFSYPENATFSPRVTAAYYLVPDLTSVNFAYGMFFQTPALPLFGDRFSSEINRRLESALATHYVGGVEHILAPGLRVSLEGYFKEYIDIPTRESFISWNETDRSEKLLNVGSRDVWGVDFFLQQKMVEDIYGTVSVSRSWTNNYDPRIGFEGGTFTSDYDYPWVVSIIAGKRFHELRSALDDAPFYLKYPSYLLPFSDDMEISARWRYASGRPYTARHFDRTAQYRIADMAWSDGTWKRSDDLNGERYPDYHRLDVAFNSRYHFSAWSLTIFLQVQNIYNRENVFMYAYNSDGTTDTIYQFAFLPVLGIEAQF
jgi:hypothetical protein